MKKQGSLLLLMLSLAFGAFILGFFLGRNYTQTPVQVSAVQVTQATSPTAQDASAPVPESTEASGMLVNINTADQQTLMNLPGIGDVLSQRIIDYRQANGPFAATSDLLNVEGIGHKRLESILPLVTVGG